MSSLLTVGMKRKVVNCMKKLEFSLVLVNDCKNEETDPKTLDCQRGKVEGQLCCLKRVTDS